MINFRSIKLRLVSYVSISSGLLLILISLYFTYESLNDLTYQNLWVNKTINVIYQTSRFQLIAKDIQSNVRGYIITGNNAEMSDILASKMQLVSITDTLYSLLENKDQRQRVKEITEIASKFVEFTQGVINTYEASGQASAAEVIKSGKGIRLFNELNATINEINQNSYVELNTRRVLATDLHKRTVLYIIFTGMTGFAITLLSLYFLLSDRKKQASLKRVLVQKERLLNQYLEAIPDGIIVVNPSMEITFINKSGRVMLGLKKDKKIDSVEYLMDELIFLDSNNKNQPYTAESLPLRQGLNGIKSNGNRINFYLKGMLYNFESNVEPIYEMEGDIIGAISVFRDVTEREAYASNLKNARDIAEQSVRVRDVFLSNVSHEIRTPLNAILGFTNWLQRETNDKKLNQYIGYIQIASNNLLELINDLLDISKIEANQIVLEKAPTSIAELVESVGILIQQRAFEKGIEFRQELSKDLPKAIITDKLRLTQILLNICGNAIKFTEQGYVSITVFPLGAVTNGEQKVQFRIKDTGIGIPEAKLGLIFDRFVQATENTNSKFGGTGLGLSITKALVQILGGTIELESTLAKGTEFILTFGFTVEEVDELVYRPQNLEAILPGHLAKLNILVAEDNILNQKLLEAIFSRVGTKITVVSNGLEAVELLEKQAFDAIIMDVQMPVMDGYSAIRIIRNELKLNTPIITMTAHALVGEKDEGARIGADSYISKPFKEQELFNELIKLTTRTPKVESISLNESLKKTATLKNSLIDLDYFDEITGGDASLQNELIELFEDEIKGKYSLLFSELEKEDYDKLRKSIHALRSSMISVALLTTSAKFMELEKELALKRIPENMKQELNDLEQELYTAMQDLKAIH